MALASALGKVQHLDARDLFSPFTSCEMLSKTLQSSPESTQRA